MAQFSVIELNSVLDMKHQSTTVTPRLIILYSKDPAMLERNNHTTPIKKYLAKVGRKTSSETGFMEERSCAVSPDFKLIRTLSF